MSFSRGQQPALRQYLAMAWSETCAMSGASVSARCAKSSRCGLIATCSYCSWYEAILVKATGKRSTTECNAAGHYEAFMRDLEVIHQRSIVWQVKAAGGNVRRMEWLLADALPGKSYSLDYIRGVAKRALKLDYWPDLETLQPGDRRTVLEALKSKGRHERDCAAPSVRVEIDEPF